MSAGFLPLRRKVPDGQRFRSVHALPLRLRGEAIGAMNLFHTRPGPLPEGDLRLGQALADIARIGILQERAIRQGEVLTEQLQTALDNRVVIEQAKGVLAKTARSPARSSAPRCDDTWCLLNVPSWRHIAEPGTR